MSSPITAQLIAAGVMTGTAVLTGTPLDIADCSRCSFQAVWTGTAVGAFAFETNNHPQPLLGDGTANPSAPGWTALTLPSAFTAGNPAGTAGSFMFEFNEMGERWIRPKYTNASSTGVLQVYGAAKA